MRTLPRWLSVLLATCTTGATPVLAQGTPCYTATLTHTDSLRAETYRKSTNGAALSPRATVVRRLANRIDSIQVGCVATTPPRDTVITPPPRDTLPTPPRDTTPTPPPDPTPTPVPVPLGKVVQLNPSQRFQTMTGWRSGGLGYDCPGYARYRDALITRVVGDYNLTHRSIEVRSGAEHTSDLYAQLKAGRITDSVYRAAWFAPINDNADPLVTDSSKFHWSFLDDRVRTEVLPWRAAVTAAGKAPYVTLLVVDFKTAAHGNLGRPFDLLKNAEEYAEWVTMAFVHMQRTYGWVPDAIEVTLEPENSQTYGPDVGRAIVAARRRLAAKGFRPEFAAPSNTTARNVVSYMRDITAAGAAPEWVVWHRYIAPRPDSAVLAGIRALPGKKAMTEYNQTNTAADAADLLFEDLTLADVSTWVIYLGAACGRQDNPENKGALLQVNIVDSLAPKINDTYRGAILRQVYASVNAGDRRIGAAVGDTSARVAAFLRPDGGIVVTLRARAAGTYTVKGLPPGAYDVSYTLAQSLTRVAQPTFAKSDPGDVQVTIPGNGVLSIVPRGGGPVTPPPTDTTITPPVTPDTSGGTQPPPPTPVGIQDPELPRAVPIYPLALHTRPCTDRPTTLAQLRAALGGANRTVCLAPGATFIGAVDIPARAAGDTSWSVLRAEGLTLTLGQRLTGLEQLPQLVAGNDLRFPALWIHANAARWLIQGVRITTDSTIADLTPHVYRLALIEIGERTGNTAANIPRHIHFAHVAAQGWPRQQIKTGVYINAADVTFRDGTCTEIHVVNADNQCLLVATAPGPFLFENSLLQAASENVMFGGGDPSIPGLVPCDATIRGNTISKPIAWKAIGTPGVTGSYLVKLLLEAKNACRVLVERNRFDGVWSDGQTGWAVALKSVNQNGNCRWCRVTDITIRRNTFVNVGASFQLAGRPEAFPVDTALSRVAIYDNWIDSVNIAPFVGEGGRSVKALAGIRDLQIMRNTWTTAGAFTSEALVFQLGSEAPVTGFRFDQNVLPIAVYGVGATASGEGNTALTAAVRGTLSFEGNAFIGAPRTNYPTTTTWHSSLAAALATGAGIAARPVP